MTKTLEIIKMICYKNIKISYKIIIITIIMGKTNNNSLNINNSNNFKTMNNLIIIPMRILRKKKSCKMKYWS